MWRQAHEQPVSAEERSQHGNHRDWVNSPPSVRCSAQDAAGRTSQAPLSGSRICAWPNLGSVAFACTSGMIGKTRKPMSTTKCVCGVTHIEKEGVLTRARAQRASQEPAAAEGYRAPDGLGCGPSPRRLGRDLRPRADAPNQAAPTCLARQDQHGPRA
jgi:hypothetical protein